MDEQLLRRLEDQSALCLRRGYVTHTDFLRPEEADQAESYLRRRRIRFLFHGGRACAEKRAVFFLPDWMEEEDFVPGEHIAAVEILPADHKAYAHGDYLGSLMALGLRREKLGDVIVGEDRGYTVCFPELQDYLCQQLSRLSRTSALCRPISLDDLPEGEKEQEVFTVSVASLRADALVSAAFHISRTRAAEAITAGLVAAGHETLLKGDRLLGPDTVLTLRGKGRVRLVGETGQSRKGRHLVEFSREKDRK